MLRVCFEHDVNEEGNEIVGSFFARDVSNQSYRKMLSRVREQIGRGRTKDDLAAVEDADELVARRFVLIDFVELFSGKVEESPRLLQLELRFRFIFFLLQRGAGRQRRVVEIDRSEQFSWRKIRSRGGELFGEGEIEMTGLYPSK